MYTMWHMIIIISLTYLLFNLEVLKMRQNALISYTTYYSDNKPYTR